MIISTVRTVSPVGEFEAIGVKLNADTGEKNLHGLPLLLRFGPWMEVAAIINDFSGAGRIESRPVRIDFQNLWLELCREPASRDLPGTDY
jgi:hypothetical protein